MHPFHYHHGFRGGMGMGWHRGPSRIVWFLIGAGVTAWWIKRKDNDKRIFGHCMRPALPPMNAPPVDADDQSQAPVQRHPGQSCQSHRHEHGHGHSWGWQWQWPQNISEIPQAVNNIPPATPSPYPPTPGAYSQEAPWKFDAEKEHFAKISKQAADAMTELTESTLNSVLATAETLKVKLAEHKAEREKQQKIIDQQIEEQRRTPPRLV